MSRYYNNLPLEPGGNVFGPSGDSKDRTVQSPAEVKKFKRINKEIKRRQDKWFKR